MINIIFDEIDRSGVGQRLSPRLPSTGKDNMANTDHEHGYQVPWSWLTDRRIIFELCRQGYSARLVQIS